MCLSKKYMLFDALTSVRFERIHSESVHYILANISEQSDGMDDDIRIYQTNFKYLLLFSGLRSSCKHPDQYSTGESNEPWHFTYMFKHNVVGLNIA